MKNYTYLEQQCILPTYPRRGLTLVRGEGVYLYDQTGKKYLDMMSNYGVNILGYGNKEILRKLHKQLEILTNLHGSFSNDARSQAAQKLLSLCPKPLSQVYFSSSGAEAVEAALKFAALATGRRRFVVMKGAYHGKTLGALSATSGAKYRKPFEPLLWEFVEVEYDNLKALERALNEEAAGVIVEPIQGESGIIVPKKGYLKSVAQLCKKKGALFILDEIQTGVGRTGRFFAFESESAVPDIVCLGKGLASGLPVGATIVSSEIAKHITRNIHTSTFGGNPLTSRGIIANLEYLEKHKIFSRVSKMGSYFVKQLSQIKSAHIKEVRGVGLMIGVEITVPLTPVLKAMQERGVLVIPGGERAVRFLPPYIIEKKHVDQAVEVLEGVLKQI